MNKMNIAKIDLNLLLIFHAVMEEQTTVKAASRLGLSQPAISHGLNRLRDLLGDRLFVRSSRGVIPTPKAICIEPTVRELLERAERVFFDPPEFNPKLATDTFRIATTDYFEQVALPEILKRIESVAPNVTLISRPTGGYLPKEGLEKGDYDLAIAGFYKDIPDRFFKQTLFKDNFVFVAPKSKRIGKSPVTYEQYAKLRHMVISPQGDLKTQSKALMKKQGYDIQYYSAVTGFLSPARILSMTNLSLTCPRRLAESYIEFFPLKIYELPFKIPTMDVVQVWHERQQDSPAHKWLRQMFHEVCSGLKPLKN